MARGAMSPLCLRTRLAKLVDCGRIERQFHWHAIRSREVWIGVPSLQHPDYAIQVAIHVQCAWPLRRISCCFATSLRVSPVMIAMRESEIFRSAGRNREQLLLQRPSSEPRHFAEGNAIADEYPYKGLHELAIGGEQPESHGIRHRKNSPVSSFFGRCGRDYASGKHEVIGCRTRLLVLRLEPPKTNYRSHLPVTFAHQGLRQPTALTLAEDPARTKPCATGCVPTAT